MIPLCCIIIDYHQHWASVPLWCTKQKYYRHSRDPGSATEHQHQPAPQDMDHSADGQVLCGLGSLVLWRHHCHLVSKIWLKSSISHPSPTCRTTTSRSFISIQLHDASPCRMIVETHSWTPTVVLYGPRLWWQVRPIPRPEVAPSLCHPDR